MTKFLTHSVSFLYRSVFAGFLYVHWQFVLVFFCKRKLLKKAHRKILGKIDYRSISWLLGFPSFNDDAYVNNYLENLITVDWAKSLSGGPVKTCVEFELIFLIKVSFKCVCMVSQHTIQEFKNVDLCMNRNEELWLNLTVPKIRNYFFNWAMSC